MSEQGEDRSQRFVAALEAGDAQRLLEVVKEVYAAGSSGDWESLDSLFDPDVVWEPPPDAPTAGTYRGAQGAAEEVAAWTEPFEDFDWRPHGLRMHGDRVLVCGRMSGRGRGSGAPVEIEEFHVITLRQGRIARLQMFLDRRAALEAAGLPTDAE